MGLADLIKQGPTLKQEKCVVGKIIDSLDKKDSESVNEAIEQVREGTAPFSAAWLRRTLMSEGHSFGESTFSRHIAKGCTCESE